MILKKLYKLFLSFLFEKDQLLQKIELMDVETFRISAEPAKKIPIGTKDIEMYALFSYKDPLARALVWNIKFRRNKKCIALAGELLCSIVPINHLIIPVPISRKRLRERGYNQVKLLADAIKHHHKEGLEAREILEDCITRKHTSPQTSLSREDRAKNLRGVFEITRPDIVYGKNIVILDDVITTGATMTEIARALKAAGAKKILALSLAH